MTKIIEVIVTPDGQSIVQTKGFTGDQCRKASRFLEEALGTSIGERLTAEFHQAQTTQVHEELRQ